MITTHNLRATTLLKNPDVIHSGYLKYQVSYGFFKVWKEYFAILMNETIYFYKNYQSESPNRLEGLQGINHIEINTGINNPSKCIFVINFKDLSIKPRKFAASSKEQMKLWVNKLNNMISNDSENYEEINDYEVPCQQQSISTTFREDLPEQIILEQIENKENEYENKVILPNSSLTNNINNENVFFYGNKNDAFKILMKNNQIGSYLIRKDDERLILTVKCVNLIMKFILRTDEINLRISIQGEKESFSDIPSLLEYYSLNNLPRQNCKLGFPINMEIFQNITV